MKKGKISLILLSFLCHLAFIPYLSNSIKAHSFKNSNTAQSIDKISLHEETTHCEWHFSGHLGTYTDRIAENRILDETCWNTIYPETEEAFRLREDDISYPKTGKWRGEFWGRYILSAIACSKYYHSRELKKRIQKAVDGLISTQEENGYIGTYTRSGFVIGDNWNVWSRKYTLWALIEAWELLQDENILRSAQRFADHFMSEVGPGAVDIIQTGNFYGMASTSILYPMVRLYKITGEQKYLEYAEYIVNQWNEHPEGLPDILNKGLTGKPVHNWFPENDPYKWAKGSELLSCVEGLAELFTVTDNGQYLESAENIHSALVKWERTPVGSLGFNDKYAGATALINTLSEICDVVYWERLSYKLFQLTGKEKYIAEIERSLYNSLLCAYNNEGTWGLRRLRMSHIHVPAQNHFLKHHHCCVENVPRGLFQAAEAALTNRGDNIYLSLFSEGEGKVALPSGNTATVKLEGDFLKDESVILSFSLEYPEKFKFYLRNPHWSAKTGIYINGKKFNGKILEKWTIIDREWQNGDELMINFDMNVWWETFDPEKFKDTYHDIHFYEKQWAGHKFSGATDEDKIRRYGHVESLPEEYALPHKSAVTFFFGPVALARDIRITEGDIFVPVDFSGRGKSLSIKPIEAPDQIWKAWEVNLGGGRKIHFCDFSSAGNTWAKSSEFNTWCILNNE
jgi:uncharacterized protein